MTRPKQNDSKFKAFMRENVLTMATVIGVFAGGLVGFIIKNSTGEWTKREIMYISFPGEIFLRMLKCLIVPLLVSSITSAIGGLDLSMSSKIATRAITYYFVTTISAVVLGICLVTTLRPGQGAKIVETHTESVDKASKVLTPDTLMDLVRNMFTDNIIQSTMFQYRTEIFENTSISPAQPMEAWQFKSSQREGSNVLGLVMFSVILGTTIGRMREKGQLLQDFFTTLSEAMMTITSWVIWISPLGVAFLIAAKIIEMESIAATIQSLGWYFITVMIGLFLHGFGTIAVIFFLGTRRLPYRYIAKLSQVLATAFGTGSSSATMPLTIKCLDNMGIDPRVTRFVIPVGATINMDGTALYEAVAALFIAQYREMSYSFGTIVAVSITATAASIGAAGIPQAGLVTMVMVLDTVGLEPKDVSLIIAVDWLLDRFRTTINVMCDALGTILVNHLSKNDLASVDRLNAEPHELLELGANGHEMKE
ncbi:GL26138 [Drosophila persimilis]|uniref:Amino acid transporter n=2 Tax=pseudoobscura subgroup TaxID=32358 RepID=Q29PH0_DROPS|nr:excitatory amino acid transporter 1 [Drosophila persimilis]XP_015035314.1 excitatory amino acid transporter 1 [Drosophila pseudoobscura]XP_017155033.1 excitatory amino acid transporter 1 [Drosophila miranda]XP_017155034.1 excitatory amino acid transporter 1 [Drosophila miranda]XP_017155035.1 excitatory amino acid transporter 1 [Drosophila miranda]EDW37228.1 GL26138 [Drosophila persimilis]